MSVIDIGGLCFCSFHLCCLHSLFRSTCFDHLKYLLVRWSACSSLRLMVTSVYTNNPKMIPIISRCSVWPHIPQWILNAPFRPLTTYCSVHICETPCSLLALKPRVVEDSLTYAELELVKPKPELKTDSTGCAQLEPKTHCTGTVYAQILFVEKQV